jgi:hypothetical protein
LNFNWDVTDYINKVILSLGLEVWFYFYYDMCNNFYYRYPGKRTGLFAGNGNTKKYAGE